MVQNIGYTVESNDASIGLTDTINLYFATSPDYFGELEYFYLRVKDTFGTGEYGRGAIYLSSNRTLVAQTEPFQGTGVDKTWISGAFNPSSITANTNYIVALWTDENAKYSYCKLQAGCHTWNDGSRDYSASGNGDFGAYLNPLDNNSQYSYATNYDIEMYVTYRTYGRKMLQIYYSSMSNEDFIDCDCSRWDVNDYGITIEVWLKKSDLQILRRNITPGAVDELYTILGRPTYYDKTWTGNNTLKLLPNIHNDSNLKDMREETIIYVKNISDSPIAGASGYINVKIEGYLSGSQRL